MPIYYALGNHLIAKDELVEKGEALKRFREGKDRRFEFRTGVLESKRDIATFSMLSRGNQPFIEIGLGKPLTIWISSVYPADLPPKGLFGGGRGALVSSAVKSWQSFDMKPRALNILKQAVKRRVAIPRPAATEEGTPVVFYSPALVDRSLTLTVEMAFDNVDEAFFAAVGGIFGSAAGLPVFVSAAPYLLAASQLFKIGGKIGNSLFDSRAEFQATETINIDLPGPDLTAAGFALLTRSEMDEKTLAELYIPATGEVLNKVTNAPYDGNIPYVVVALDGRADASLIDFKATAASAALLQQFYNIREDGQTTADILVDAMKFYNDFRYREEAGKVKEQIDKADTDEEKKKLEERYKALVKNIQSKEFQP